MSIRVDIKPELLRWACERNARDADAYLKDFPKLLEWIAGTSKPTLDQLEAFASKTHTPVGFLFLSAPPDEPLPVRDFRTMPNRTRPSASPELLDTVYDVQGRQAWYRQFMISAGAEPLPFVGSARVGMDVALLAAKVRHTVGFDVATRTRISNADAALGAFVKGVEDAGILVMRSGVVRHSTHRALEPEEFRGFALADPYAPVIFVNSADAKAAQSFTVAHELAHIWLGESGVSDERPDLFDGTEVERWCNAVAAELLVPLEDLRARVQRPFGLSQVPALTRTYRVSDLVILRRLRDLGVLSQTAFAAAYRHAYGRATAPSSSTGGDFYATLPVRVSAHFARAIVASALEGQTRYRDALDMLGLKSVATLDKLATHLGIR